MNFLEEMQLRGVIKDVSNKEKFLSLPKNTGVYVGFDPTATSLHLGNYIQISMLKRFQKAGYKVYALLGGATGMIGDPLGKTEERKLLSNETVIENKNKIRKQLESFGLEVVDNYDFYKDMSFLDFLREVGKKVNISYLLAKDLINRRVETGLSFTEFSYTLIQGYDFLRLYKDKDVRVQFGGSDQWGNIITGLDMIAKEYGDEHKAVAISFNLLTDKNGNKFGKSTGGGSLWLDKEINPAFKMYQFLATQEDSEVEKLLKWYTFLSLDEIAELMQKHNQEPQNRLAQKTLAFEVVKDIHGEKEALEAQKVSEVLFSSNLSYQDLSESDFDALKKHIQVISLNKNELLIDQLIAQKVISSKREYREFLAAGSLRVNGVSLTDENYLVDQDLLHNKFALFKKGKKNLYILEVK
ncbi:tyrosine--tRNA ligase [Mycoplasma sp. Ms02]|uniref:tyrosine--tRNA ligase n=1 Tax=Mycoplasma sp. Ms02 TaxID=353851 RepID=UPI001C8A8A53|nr:tyrosine--tRNA ligase [Mycoplasma sp. Ms02]QZE12217.1 tyrosine--tRNA ligase [Mycoplasma sp. Ms02]